MIAALGSASAVGVVRARQGTAAPHPNTPTTKLAASSTPFSLPLPEPLPRTEGAIRAPDPFERLAAVMFKNRNNQQTVTTKLYGHDGHIDESAATQLDTLLSDTRDPNQPKTTQIERRLLQLLFRTAYHFQASSIEVTSAYRATGRRREGLHATGRAIDFAIAGVKTEELASYLRKLPRVGVGVYTHRRTRFVHLDVREQSYHWLDASPPGRTWRGLSIGDRGMAARDATYRAEDDWPEPPLVPRER